MRNRLVHACFEADLDLVRKTEQEDLPAPIARIEPLDPLVPPKAE